MDAQKQQDEAIARRGKSKISKAKLDALREENVHLTLQPIPTPPRPGLVEAVMEEHGLTRKEAIDELGKFGF